MADYLHYGFSSQTNELYFALTVNRSQQWVDRFIADWNEELEKQKITMAPLGAVRIIARREIYIKQTRNRSEQWQAGLALKLMSILDKELGEP
jgi:hypothetical protein